MPRMGGPETLVELQKIRPDIKVIISSGYDETETLLLFRGYSVCGLIQKPYTTKRLMEK